MDDGFGADRDLLAALAASDAPGPSRVNPRQPVPQRIQQPTPQRLDRPPPGNAASGPGSASGVKQPTPQALPQRAAGSSILVSPRQKGNPVLACLKSLPWEYSDIPADYGLGLTTCALFLSLKYHRLHPEYIYTRIRNLQGRYNLRILLTIVDIPNHEDSLRELSKTSLVNNVTLVLCWSAAEAARYLELYKSYEHANFAAIKGAQATSYADRLVEFVTVPRAVNKTDAVALVSTFGSLKAAINADPETIGVIGGWGEKKVKAWSKAVEEPFRVKKSAKRRLETEESTEAEVQRRRNLDVARPIGRVPQREMAELAAARSHGETSAGEGAQQQARRATQFQIAGEEDGDEDEDAELAAAIAESKQTAEEEARVRIGAGAGPSTSERAPSGKGEDKLASGVAAALAKLRKG
ncbi:putative mating-type switching protein swi10 [Diaporthe ampelina]|uniref:Putative mating-type switching protein swi10 n=1 Tax=Diaporthe ampelina TaxID=1214573 RepID=A0A0G2FY28_9PEZI|nr:putative mating-type switching protein swi10 [Diaporthe ampelina]